MKTKVIAIVMVGIAIASQFNYLNMTVYAKDVTTVEKTMTWSEYKSVSVTKETPMVYELVNRLSAIEYEDKKNLKNSSKTFGYGGLSAERFAEEYPICKKITEAFNAETGLNVKVTMDKLSSKYCQIDISTEMKEPIVIAKTGETATLGLGNSYYESAWGFGSGNSYWIMKKGYIHAYMDVNVLAIARLDDYGNVTDVNYSKGTAIKQHDNVMVLIGTENTTIGWVAPHTIEG